MIITDPSKLRVECSDVSLDEYQELREILEKELELSPIKGIGLAAPQIGIAKNMAIVRLNDIKIDLVNCRITNKYDKFLFDGEGCLSFPNQFERTFRYNEIEVSDNLVYPYNFICTGLLAVVCQHELDHLVGVLLPDMAVKR